MSPVITEIETVEFTFPLENVSLDEGASSIHGVTSAANLVYDPGSQAERRFYATKVDTDAGGTGEFVGRVGPTSASKNLLGRDPLDREDIWRDTNGDAALDIALWDFGGKHHSTPIHKLLGSSRTSLPAYASAAQGDVNGGLDSPEAYADFAERCVEEGYQAFKIHSWKRDDHDNRNTFLQREIETIRAVRERVGEKIDLMLDPFGQYRTLGEAMKVGKACDDNQFFWFEDPTDGVTHSQYGSRKLRQTLSTSLIETENVHNLQAKTDFLINEATDFLRVNPAFDGGITGAIKAARIAEGFGIDVEYHAVGPAQRQCMAATFNSNYYEMNLLHPDRRNVHYPPIYEGEYADVFDAVDEKGTVPVPQGPGLGVNYDWEYIYDNAVTVEQVS